MNEQSIEFGSLEDPLTPKIIRKSFRIPVAASEEINILIKGKGYTLADISMNGIGFYVEDKTDFTIDENLNGCEFRFNGNVIKNLTGTIVHFSQEKGQKGKYGIKWKELPEDILNQIQTIFLEVKQEYLSKNGSDSDSIE